MAGSVVSELGGLVIDVTDLERMAAFWGELLGLEPGQPRSGGGWLTVGALDETAWLVLQHVPERKTVKNRVHLDFRVDDVDEAIARIIALGGSRLGEPREGGGVTMADPEGNEFCIGAFQRTRTGKRVPVQVLQGTRVNKRRI